MSPATTPDSTALARRATGRRVLVLTFVIFTTAPAVLLMADLLWGMPMRGWNGIVLALYAMLFGMISFGASQAFFGFCARRGGGDPGRIDHPAPDDAAVPLAPTAVIMPVYNENVTRVLAGLRATYRSLQDTGELEHFDFFILSDSTNPNTWIQEEMAWVDLSRELRARGRLFYRRRSNNSNKKAGNIADFCRRWGRRYRYMVVLDADSVMTGATLVRLVRLMENHPRAGLIQTAPRLVRAETLFARIQQFAMRLYGSVFLAGLNYWTQAEANYWGHNAVIRLAPFMQHCALPELPGREPFGGKILSHDFVEAALLRRAGWEVWIAPELDGSYEEGPPTLIDSAKRDRRWCQGNLQHFWLLFARGLRGVSRVHLGLGILSYSASLFWLISLLIGSLLVIGHERTGLTWVPDPGFAESIGVTPSAQVTTLLCLTILLLFGPKLLAVMDTLLKPGAATAFGGVGRILTSVLLESLFSMLLAPVLMLFHATFVVATLLGRGITWVPQRREGADGSSWGAAWRTHQGHTLVGLGWAAGLAWFAPHLLAWISPVLAGLIFSVPLSVFSSRLSAGRAARRAGLFCTPEELHPPRELVDVEEAVAAAASRTGSIIRDGDDGLKTAIVDPYVNAIHVCLTKERAGRAEAIANFFANTRERLLHDGPEALSTRDKAALLSDAESMTWLHREIWRRNPKTLSATWQDLLNQHIADRRLAA